MAGGIWRRIGTRPKCDFRPWTRWRSRVCGFSVLPYRPALRPVSRLHVYRFTFAGQYSTENGMWRGPGKQPLGSPGYRGIKRDVKMLPEHLAEAGYKTALSLRNGLKTETTRRPGRGSSERPRVRRVSRISGRGSSVLDHRKTIEDHAQSRTGSRFQRARDRVASSQLNEFRFGTWAEKFIRKNAGAEDPFFCYLAYNAVHGPLRTDKSKPASAPEAWVKKALDRGVSFPGQCAAITSPFSNTWMTTLAG